MLVKNKLGQEIEIESIYGKYENDIQIGCAYYVDTNKDISDEDLEYIYENYQQELYEKWYENQACQAEYYWDLLQDR